MNALELADKLEKPMLDNPDCPNFSRTRDFMEQVVATLRQQQAEIEALKELNTMLKDAIEKRIGMDAERYKWLRAEFAAGRETYLAEDIFSGETLDKYIDGNLNK